MSVSQPFSVLKKVSVTYWPQRSFSTVFETVFFTSSSNVWKFPPLAINISFTFLPQAPSRSEQCNMLKILVYLLYIWQHQVRHQSSQNSADHVDDFTVACVVSQDKLPPPGSLKIFNASALAVGPSFLFGLKYRFILRQMAGKIRTQIKRYLDFLEPLTSNSLTHNVRCS